MQNYVVARGGVPRGPRREGPYEDGYVSHLFFLFTVSFHFYHLRILSLFDELLSLWRSVLMLTLLPCDDAGNMLQVPSLPPHVQHSQSVQGPSSSNDGSLPGGGQVGGPATLGSYGGGGEVAPTAVFGFDLTDAMTRDGDEVPRILEVCTKAIEDRGACFSGCTYDSGLRLSISSFPPCLLSLVCMARPAARNHGL